VTFSKTAFSIVSEVGRRLRENGAIKPQRIEGFIVSLRAETTLIDGFEGVVTLKSLVGGSPALVQVTLNRDEYARACDAHKDAKPVAVTGMLHREAKFYRLLEPQTLQVLESPP
jgi:hypothetical protein